MIKKLRRKITFLIITVLILISFGIVCTIQYMNWNHIVTEADSALETLAENSGLRPRPKKPEQDGSETLETEEDNSEAKNLPALKPSPGQPVETEDEKASLSNYYVAYLTIDGEVKSWTSDRSDLYTDAQIVDMVANVLATGKQSGNIGTQFYMITSRNGQKMVIVMDERLEIANLRNVLKTTALTAATACLLLCIAAYILIRIMLRPVKEAFERQRRFVGDASHELKTPLAVIGANADVLASELGDNEYLQYIRSEVSRTNRLVQDLLTLARMDEGKQAVKLADIDPGKAVLSVALPFESRIYEEGKQFEQNVPEGLHCRADEAMLKQLTVILLSNALKYSEEKGRIGLYVGQRGRGIELKVTNTGEPIPREERSKIFDRFYRADTARSRHAEGFGFGLSIAAKIVALHKGRIHVECEKPRETAFRIFLPG